ncbi:MAG: agmatine deiminase family protein, partial [Chitinophagaceae bacterium]|nr:agmatine deiminase family protein [Chitinophagaceae bacterium]
IRVPAEWEKQERVHLAWFGKERRDSVLCRVIEALQPSVPLTLNIPADSLMTSICLYLSKYRIDTARIDFVTDRDVDFWTRDPLFFVTQNDSLKVVCFNYSMYGVYPDIANEPLPDDIKKIGEYDERLAAQLKTPTIKSDFVFEGGGIESNGKGTFIIIKEMALQRNPGKNIADIEAELRRTLGAKKIIWLKDGLAEDKVYKDFGPFYRNYFGGGANMHVDELCRFVNEATVILPQIPKQKHWENPVDSINHFMLEQNFRILSKATTYQGKKIKIYRIPMPEVTPLLYSFYTENVDMPEMQKFGFKLGDTIHRVPAASYVNFFVSNKVVLMPKYWKPGMSEIQKQKDEEAKRLLQKLFPERKVVQIYTLTINRGGGGLHCMTHEQPLMKN